MHNTCSRRVLLEFRLVLIGRAIDYLPYFLFTFIELGRTGLGPGRGQFTVAEVHAEGLHGDRQMYSATDGVLHEHLSVSGRMILSAIQLVGACGSISKPDADSQRGELSA